MNASGQLMESYTRGVGFAGNIGTLVAITFHPGSGRSGTYYIHNNHRGDIVLTRSGTATVGSYDYTAFGSLKSQIGPDVCRFKFSSKERDPSTGFYYYGYRHYAPAWQRWISRDATTENTYRAYGVLLGYQGRSSVLPAIKRLVYWGITPMAEDLGISSVHGIGSTVVMSYEYTFVANRPIEIVDLRGAEIVSLSGDVKTNDERTKCYTRKEIPKEVEEKLPDWAKERLNEACFKLGPLKCYPGVLFGGGVYGVCIKCYF